MITLAIDGIVLILIAIGALKGWKYGGITSALSLIATIFIFVAAFYIKDYLAPLMYMNLPFVKFAGIFEGISSLNIMLYQVLAYIIAIIGLLIILAILVKITKFLDKLVNWTLILALPNKILGLVFGAIQYYIIVYFILFIFLQIPYTSYEVQQSQIGQGMINNTPVLSDVTQELYSTYKEVYDICVQGANAEDRDGFNRLAVESMMKHNVVTFEEVKELRNQRKIEGPKIDEMITEYNQKNENKQ